MASTAATPGETQRLDRTAAKRLTGPCYFAEAAAGLIKKQAVLANRRPVSEISIDSKLKSNLTRVIDGERPTATCERSAVGRAHFLQSNRFNCTPVPHEQARDRARAGRLLDGVGHEQDIAAIIHVRDGGPPAPKLVTAVTDWITVTGDDDRSCSGVCPVDTTKCVDTLGSGLTVKRNLPGIVERWVVKTVGEGRFFFGVQRVRGLERRCRIVVSHNFRIATRAVDEDSVVRRGNPTLNLGPKNDITSVVDCRRRKNLLIGADTIGN